LIRLFNAYFPVRTVCLGVTEVLLVALAFLLAIVATLGPLDASIALAYEQGLIKIGIVVGVFLLCMYYFDLYDSMILSNQREAFIRLVQVFGTVCLLFGAFYYIFPSLQLGMGTFLIGMALAVCEMALCHRVFLFLNTISRFAEPCVILGNAALAKALIEQFATRPELGTRVVCQLSDDSIAAKGEIPSSTWGEELKRIVGQSHIRRVIVAMDDQRGKLPVETLLELKSEGVRIQDGVELYQSITGKISLHSLRLSWLVFSPGFQVSRLMLVYKRLLSVCLSITGLLLMLPVMMVIAIAIRLDSPGSIIFRQKRVGKNGRLFTLYKFRSMIDGAERHNNFKPASKGDSRITRVGALLRKSRLDELPQLFNILLGDMYFIGPRPFVRNQEEECMRHIPFYKQRWSVRPGATGWAQVNRDYCTTIEDNAEKLSYDLFYIKNVSVGLDLLILFKSIKILLLGRGGQ
jgi:sugar transferase (PEP-CTERM system associated)